MLNKYSDILTVEELCEVLQIEKNTPYKLRTSNEIKSIKIGKIYKIPKKSVRKYLEQNT